MREEYENEWFPSAYAMGVTWEQFWTLNPHILKILIKADSERQKSEIRKANSIAHLQGQYFMEGLLATVGNMLSGKSAKKHKYPEKPYELYKNKELTEEDLQKQRELFVARLMAMQTNFELNHKDGSVS